VKGSHRDDGAVSWAIVGSSEFALDWLVPALLAADGADLGAVVTRHAAALRRRWRVPPGVHIGERLDELVDLGIEAVHVATPNRLHASLGVTACQLGLHVLVEKPMGITAAECSAMVAAARANHVSLFVACSMAWAPPIAAAAALVRDGRIGTPVHASISAGFDAPPAGVWRQTEPTAAGGGPLYDLGPHAIDALLRILGPVDEVQAVAGHRRYDYPADDTISLQLRFASGAHAHVHVSFAADFNALVVTGTDGELASTEWLGRRFRGNLAHRAHSAGAARFDDTTAVADVDVELPTVDVLRAQVEETSAAIRGEQTQARNAASPAALDVAHVLDAAVASLTSGGRVFVRTPA
jgi:glucose-fructose oxidoreductase